MYITSMHNLLGALAFFVMCIVGCIQKWKLRPRPHRANTSQPRSEVEIQDLPSEQDNDCEENGEAYKTRSLSQAPPPAYRNANKYQTVDLKDITNIVQVIGVTKHCTDQDSGLNLSPPEYTNDSSEPDTAGILGSDMDYSQTETGTHQNLPPPYCLVTGIAQEYCQ